MAMILCLLYLVGGPVAPAGSAESSGSPIQFLVGEWAGESEGQPGKGTVWEAPKALEPLRFLLGEWQGEGGAKPGEASGGFTFAPGLQGRVILRTNVADYPATG